LVSVKVERSLREIGLTEYESLAYLALVKSGELTASKVSKLASIPYSKVYGVLDSLERKGWVEIKGGRPRHYYPRPPVEALRAEELRKASRFEQIRKLLVSELQPLYEQRDVKEKPEIWIIRGVENIASTIREIPQKVKRELMVALPEIPTELSPAVLPSLEPLRDKKVEIHLLTTPDLIESIGKYIANVAEIKVRDEMFGGGVVIDGKETLLFLGEDVTEEQNLAIWSDHVGLNMIAKIYFEHLWDTAEPYKKPRLDLSSDPHSTP
jgi:sugar-specific transcriptional regulator TrmB